MNFNQQLYLALRGEPSTPLLEYKGCCFTRGEILDFAEQTEALLQGAGVPKNAKVGVVVRNRVLHAAAILGLIAHGRALTTVYSLQSPEAIAAEAAASDFGAVIADAQDWSELLRGALKSSGSAGIVLSHETGEAAVLTIAPGLDHAGPGPFAKIEGEQGLEILSSGTTGKPKRILFPFRMLTRAIESVTVGRSGPIEPEVLTWPYGGIGGICNLVAGVILGRQTTILDKFNVAEWVEGIKKHRPKAVSGPPAVARMILDAKVSQKDIASIKYFFGGGAPMSPELQDEFEKTYGIKVVWAYGATEFCGTIISWTPELCETHGLTKKGAMGRALPGIELRVVDTVSGEPLPANAVGYLAAIVPAIKPDWIVTTDLALIDEDGFVFHKGRGDGAIMRGGFKILPEKIVAALHKHPDVLDAAVIGLPDARLGEVPVAAIELKAGSIRPSEEELRDHAKKELVIYDVPTRFLILDALPRTPSLKVDLQAVRRLFQ